MTPPNLSRSDTRRTLGPARPLGFRGRGPDSQRTTRLWRGERRSPRRRRVRGRLLRARHASLEGRPQRVDADHGLDALGLHPREQPEQPGQDAEPRRADEGLAVLLAGGPRGDADRPGPPRPADRRALVPVPQLRADQGPPGRSRLDPDPGHLPDRHRGGGRGGHRDRLLHGQPVPDRPPLRQLPPHRRHPQAELLPGRLPLPQQAVQAPGDAQPDRALPAAGSCPTASRSDACARWSAGTRSTATTTASTRRRG